MSPFAVFRPAFPFQVHHLDLTGRSALDRTIILRAELYAARAAAYRALASRPS